MLSAKDRFPVASGDRFSFYSLILTFTEGLKMLRENGIEIGDEDDLR